MTKGWKVEVAKRRTMILRLRARGLTMEAVAIKVGMTRQRVGQIIRDEQKRAEGTK